MSNENSEFKTDHISVAMQRSPGCKVSFSVSLSPQAVQAARAKAIKQVGKEASFPGFRKGKAPESMILQKFPAQVEREWGQVIANTSFQEVMKLSKTVPFKSNEIEVKFLSEPSPEGCALSIAYEVEPQVPKIDLSEIKIKSLDKQVVTPEMIDNAIDELRLYHAQWNPIVDRPVQEGDFVTLDVVTVEDSPKQICKSSVFEMNPAKIRSWLHKLVLGLTTGDTVEGMSEAEENAPEDPRFEPMLCKVTLLAAHSVEKPPIDESLAKKAGVSSVEELHDRIGIYIEEKLQEKYRDALWYQLEDVLVNNFPFELPKSLLESEKKSRLNAKKKTNKQKALSDLPLSEEEERQLEHEVEGSLRLFFLKREIAHEHKIVVEPNEILNELAVQTSVLSAEERDSMDTEEMRNRLHHALMSEKVKRHMLRHVSIV